MTYDVRKKPHT